MRIRNLRFTAIGPYAGEQYIDFDQLQSSGLYLINGPTGAGKTTVIDAIVFALYGQPSGDGADLARMRSDYATTDLRSEVELVFTSSKGTFRIMRSPEYQRAKRGGGLTKENATCKVFRLHTDGHEELLAEHITKARTLLTDIIGLTREQFVQTVVLPQGQFATFLRADTTERSKVLERIFRTAVYVEVAKILKEDASNATAQREAATKAIREAFVALDARHPFGDARDVLLLHIQNRVDDVLVDALRAPVDGLEAAGRDAAAALVAAEAAVTTAHASLGLAQREAQATSAVTTARERAAVSAKAREAAQRDVIEHATVAESAAIVIDDDADTGVWQQRAAAANTAAGALQEHITAEAALALWPGQQAARQEKLGVLEQAHATLLERQMQVPALIEVQEAIAADRPNPTDVTALAERRAALEAERSALTELDTAAARLATLAETAATAVQKADSERRAYDATATAYLAGLAAELAAELEPEHECPVCGSTEHPSPAQRSAEHVTKSMLEGALAAKDAAMTALAAATTAHDELAAQVAQMRSRTSRTSDAVADELARCAQESAALAQRSKSADDAVARTRALQQELLGLNEQVVAASADVAAAAAELAAQARAHADSNVAVTAARGAYASVLDRQQALQRLGVALAATAAALAESAQADAALIAAQAAYATLDQHPAFGDVASAQDALAAAAAGQQAARTADEAAATALSSYMGAVQNIELLCSARASLMAANEELAYLAQLFDQGRGNDSGLHIYVQQALFANVVSAANRRFEQLFGGRFRLVASEESGGDKRSTLGLGLDVHDSLTGKARSAKTLSGGETFCASLALALGLTDVVLMNAGGMRIDSLFIDEGFGSLDPKPLEDVMTMLRQLGSNGRLVGLISHVPEMKLAIPEKIDVVQVSEGKPTSLKVSWME